MIRRYGLGIFYLVSWLIVWGLHAYFVYAVDQYQHGEAPWTLLWLESSFENLASEYHQVGAFIVASKYLFFKDSPQSKEID